MTANYYRLSPGGRKNFGVDWTKWLAGDSIETSVWECEGLTLSNQTTGGAITQVVAAGGEDETDYELVNTITTANGFIETQTLTVFCRRK